MKEVKANALKDALNELGDMAITLVKVKQHAHLYNCFTLISQLLDSGIQHEEALLSTLYRFLDECDYKCDIIDLFPANMRADYERYMHGTLPAMKNDYREFVIHLN